MNKITVLKNSAGTSFNITDMTANKAAAIEGVKGNIGKTSILDLMRGTKANVQGWSIATVEEKPQAAQTIEGVKRANKLGVEFSGRNLKRERNPMVIHCVKTEQGKQYVPKAGSDFAKFLNQLPVKKSEKHTGPEYNDIAHAVGWSRDTVAIYASRAAKLGLVSITKESGAIYGRRGV